MSEDFKERTISGLTVRIDRTRCVATGNCIKVAPRVFVLDDERIVSFQDDMDAPGRDVVLDACDVCPVDALSALDEEGKPWTR